MGKKKWNVVRKTSKRTYVEDASGKQKTLLTPHGRFKKYKYEVDNDIRMTNDGKQKLDKDGNTQALTAEQKAYRHGYMSALGEQAAIHKKKNGK